MNLCLLPRIGSKCVFALLLAATLHADILDVPATANIFAAGGNAPAAPAGNGNGTAPPSIAFAAAADQILSFRSVTGQWRCCGPAGGMNGPDGLAGATDINSTGKIAGIKNSVHSMFLAAVFLEAALPGAAPGRLDFSPGALKENFLALSPDIGQVFFVGDGLTGTGAGKFQQFFVPATATRLFLGAADALGFQGDPGFYVDNSGELRATFFITQGPVPVPIPEPQSAVLTGIALAVAGVLRASRSVTSAKRRCGE